MKKEHNSSLIFIPFSLSRSHERTQEELELVFEELMHIPALSHLSTSIKRELSKIIVFESHPSSGTVCMFITVLNRIMLAPIYAQFFIYVRNVQLKLTKSNAFRVDLVTFACYLV